MILNKLASLPVGNRFYCIQQSNHFKILAHLHCWDYTTRELCCITQEIKNPTTDTAILRREYAGCYQLLCSIMYSKEGQYLDGCLQSGFRWPRKRKRGLRHRGRHYRNPSLRRKRFRKPRLFRTFEAIFAFWPRENWGECKRSRRRGGRREERKRLLSYPKILKNPLSFQLSRLRYHISECFVSAVCGFDLREAYFLILTKVNL